MPSGLIDTVQLSLNQTASINATLLSTNLSLNAPAGNINPVGASVLGVALAAAVAIAAPTIYTREKKKKQEEPLGKMNIKLAKKAMSSRRKRKTRSRLTGLTKH